MTLPESDALREAIDEGEVGASALLHLLDLLDMALEASQQAAPESSRAGSAQTGDEPVREGAGGTDQPPASSGAATTP